MTRSQHSIVAQLVALRDQSGESLQTIANRAGITRSALWKIERGESDPQLSTLIGLAAAFGKTLAIELAPWPSTGELPTTSETALPPSHAGETK